MHPKYYKDPHKGTLLFGNPFQDPWECMCSKIGGQTLYYYLSTFSATQNQDAGHDPAYLSRQTLLQLNPPTLAAGLPIAN